MNYSKMLQEISTDMSLLYVEDDVEIAQATQSFLSDYFKHIDYAKDGKEGVEKYNTFKKDNDSCYDIVVTDINMPHMNGVELSRELLTQNPDQPIIVISAHDDATYLIELINLGVNAFVLKPIEFQSLIKTLYNTANRIYEKKLLAIYIDELEKSERISSTIAMQNVAIKSTKKLQEPTQKEDKDLQVLQKRGACFEGRIFLCIRRRPHKKRGYRQQEQH